MRLHKTLHPLLNSTDQATIAAFDFDRTLTRADSVVPFLIRACGVRSVLEAVFKIFGTTWQPSRPLKLPSRNVLKEGLVAELFQGRQAEELHKIGDQFAQKVLSRLLRPHVLKRLEEHKQLGHRVVLVSASFSFYLAPMAERLNVDALLCTEVEVAADGRCTGKLAGPNCRGEEKIIRLRKWAGEEPYILHAYGDSKGDLAMLGAADYRSWIRKPLL